MKIAICARTWDESGGIGVYTRNLIFNLLRLDRKNRYVLFYANAAHVGQFSGQDNVEEVYVPFRKRLGGAQLATLVWDQISVPWQARKRDVDIIFHAKFAVPLLTSRKTVMVLHGTERFFYPQFSSASDILFFRTIYPQYLRKASAIISVSECARADILNLMSLAPEKVNTIYLAPAPIFKVINEKQTLAPVRLKYGISDSFILYVGHIYPGKNIGGLLEAFAMVRRKYDLKLVIAGGYRWKYQKDLRLIEQLGLEKHVQLLGFVTAEDLVGLYNMATLTVFPSFYESFGLTNVEANACGCPLVTSSAGGSPEAAGDAAIYVNPNETESIAHGMFQVLEDQQLRNELIAKGLENVKRFSWQNTAWRTLQVLESLGRR